MEQQLSLIPRILIALVIASCCGSALAGNSQRSALSRWLSQQAVPEIRQKLLHHPRYQDQQIRIVAETGDALSAAVVQVLQGNLQALVDGDDRPAPYQDAPTGRPGSIDSLACEQLLEEYRLNVAIAAAVGRRATTTLTLVDTATGSTVDHWHWRGRLGHAELAYLGKTVEPETPRGDLASPWRPTDVAAAAAALSREFVCSMRPHTVGTTTILWADSTRLPSALADTVSASRHYIGAYRELDVVSGSDSLYRIETRATRLNEGVWQLWLIGLSNDPGLPGVQAVTYMRDPSGMAAAATASVTPASLPGPVVLPPAIDNPARYLQVELLGIAKTERGPLADLTARLRITNLAPRALAYGLKSSGGHFRRCVGSRDHYRHDAYGYLSGVLAAGETSIDHLHIRNVRHQPDSPTGTGVCAGFRDLDVFGNYARFGARITDYVRWDG